MVEGLWRFVKCVREIDTERGVGDVIGKIGSGMAKKRRMNKRNFHRHIYTGRKLTCGNVISLANS